MNPIKWINFCLVSIILGFGNESNAQSVTADPTIVPQCLATEAEQTECVARMTMQCQQVSEGGETMLGARLCIIEEWQVWEQMRNDAYGDLLIRSSSLDRAEGDWAANLKTRVETLRAVQGAWIAYRDSECRFAVAQWGTGSLRSIAGEACRRDLTARRYFDLQDHLTLGEGN